MVVVVSCCSGNVSGMPSSSSGHCELGEMVVVNTVAAIVTDVVSRINRFSLGPNEEGSRRGRDGSRGGRGSS